MTGRRSCFSREPGGSKCRITGQLPSRERSRNFMTATWCLCCSEPYARISSDRASGLSPLSVLEIAVGHRDRNPGAGPNFAARGDDYGDRSQSANDRHSAHQNRHGKRRLATSRRDEAAIRGHSFDLVVCQFGVMFFPDKQASFREVSRVLRPGGTYLFILWDSWKGMPAAPWRLPPT